MSTFGPFPPRRQANYSPVPYGNGQGGIGTQRHGPTMIPGPTGAPGMASAPGMAAQAPTMPYTPAPVSNFQNSLNTQRAREANKAATFAAAAPYPMAPGGTEYSGAYGKGAPGLAASMAARGAFVSDNQFVANQNSGDYFQNQGLQNDANARENMTTTAKAGALNAWATAYPGQAAEASRLAATKTAATEALTGQREATTEKTRAATEQIAPNAGAKRDLTQSQIGVNEGKVRESDETRSTRMSAITGKTANDAQRVANDAQRAQNGAKMAGYQQQLQITQLLAKLAGHPTLDDATRNEITQAMKGLSGTQQQTAPQQGAPAQAPAGQGQYSQEDLQHTAQKYGITPEEVLRRLGAGNAR